VGTIDPGRRSFYLALPWAIFFRAFSPFSWSLVTSAATAAIRVQGCSFVVRKGVPPHSCSDTCSLAAGAFRRGYGG